MTQIDPNGIRTQMEHLIQTISLDVPSAELFYGAIYAEEAGTWQKLDQLLLPLPDYYPQAQMIHQQVRTVIAVTWLPGPLAEKITVILLVPTLNISASVTIKVSDLK